MHWFLHWVVNAVVLLIVSRIVPGFQVNSLLSAMFAVIIIGFINATLGLFLKIVTFPLSIITLGIFIFVVDAFVLWFSSKLVPGFSVAGFKPAFLAAFVLAIIQMALAFFSSKINAV